MATKTIILYVHGGMTFKKQADYFTYLKTKEISLARHKSWSSGLEKELGSRFSVVVPRMPLSDNAKYEDWKMLFERYLPLLGNSYMLIGESLGGIFLSKYLSENKLKKQPKAVYLVCAPFDDTLSTEDLAGGFKLKRDLSLIEKNCPKTYFFFSADDEIVPVAHAEKYRKHLPSAHITIYKSKKGHFRVSRFPEIVRLIKGDAVTKKK